MIQKKLKTVTTINGHFVQRGEDKISVFDNSLLYAEGLFETFLAINHRIIFLDEHINRLFKGAGVVGLKIPVSREILVRWMNKTVQAHPSQMVKLRLTMTSGEAARWVGIKGNPQVILSASPHELPQKPFKLYVSNFTVDQGSIFRRIKTISYAIHAAALKQAKLIKYDDTLLLNGKKQIAEVTSANIFWVKKSHIYTPPLDAGCLEGTTRSIVIKEAAKLGYPLTEKNTKLPEILTADEIFISSSLKLIIGVSHIKTDDNTFRIKSGPITKTLKEHFKKITGLK